MKIRNTGFATKHLIFLMAAIAAYVCLLFGLCWSKYRHFGYQDFDLAVHAQSTWNIIHGSFDCSILGIPFLGNHMALILFLIAPFYAILPSPLLLLFLQTLILAAGGLGIFLLARKELPEKWAWGLSATYLVYPPLIYMNLYEFHPVALATTFLIFTVYSYRQNSFGIFLVFLLLAVLCQENISLIAIAFGVYAAIDKRKGLWIWTPIATGAFYFIVVVMFVMPHLNNNTIQFWSLYRHLGDSPSSAASNILTHPLRTLQIMTSADKMAFLCSLFGPLAFLSFLDPLSLIPALPVLLQRLLSDRLSETRIIFHYQAEIIPFIFAAAILGIKRMLGWQRRLYRLLPAVALLVFTSLAILSSGICSTIARTLNASYASPFVTESKNTALRKVEPGAAVVATFDFLPRLANRQNLYSLHHIYTGHYTLSSVAYPTPQNIQYLIMDTCDSMVFSKNGFYEPGLYTNLQALVSKGNWRVTENMETVVLMERTTETPDRQPDLVHFATELPEMNTNIVQTSHESLELVGFTLDEHQPDNTASITFFWRKKIEDQKEYGVYIVLTGKAMLYNGFLYPGSRIWPSQSWPTGKFVIDKHGIRLNGPMTSSERIQLRAELCPVN
jgi:uncharacterized membrane protein